MPVTIKDIARICQVSEGSVDRALNGRNGIKRETRDKILRVARELRYCPNPLARSLATGITMTIGIICFDLYNNFFAELVDVIESAAKAKGYYINLVLTHGNQSAEIDGIQYFTQRPVDGIIIFPVGQGEEYRGTLSRMNAPIVTVYNRICDGIAHVGVDDRSAMRDCVLHMAEKGYERILFSTANMREKRARGDNIHTLEQRLLGYEDGMREAGLSQGIHIMEGKEYEDALGAQILSDKRKTGVLCVCDSYALALLKYCKSHWISVPGQLGIMGYDNVDMLSYISPRLATVGYSVDKLGTTLFETLFSLMRGQEVAAAQYLDYHLIKGETL